MKDRDIALAHLAFADAESTGDIRRFVKHWDERFDKMLAGDHSGDCTKQPFTCDRCIAEDALRFAPIYRALFNLSEEDDDKFDWLYEALNILSDPQDEVDFNGNEVEALRETIAAAINCLKKLGEVLGADI